MQDGGEATISKTHVVPTLWELFGASWGKGEVAWQFEYSVASEQIDAGHRALWYQGQRLLIQLGGSRKVSLPRGSSY